MLGGDGSRRGRALPAHSLVSPALQNRYLPWARPTLCPGLPLYWALCLLCYPLRALPKHALPPTAKLTAPCPVPTPTLPVFPDC